jgi:hypothetical protein
MPDSFQPPPSSGSYDPFEKYRISEIQKDKETRDAAEGTQTYSYTRHSAFLAYVSLIFKKFLDLFEKTTERGLALSAEKDVREHLILLKAAIEILKIEDRSQDSPFLNHLSQLWHHLIEDVLRFRRQTPMATKMRAMIKEFQNYPELYEHSLGYYLTEYAGQKWLPFPYMEMIFRLYSQHKKNPEGSILSRWSSEIQEMIQIITPPES